MSLPVAEVSSAPLTVDTLTPLPTETVAPTLTPYVPPSCLATSLIPTVAPFYTPTSIYDVTLTPAPTLTPTATPVPDGSSVTCGTANYLSCVQLSPSSVRISVVGNPYNITGLTLPVAFGTSGYYYYRISWVYSPVVCPYGNVCDGYLAAGSFHSPSLNPDGLDNVYRRYAGDQYGCNGGQQCNDIPIGEAFFVQFVPQTLSVNWQVGFRWVNFVGNTVYWTPQGAVLEISGDPLLATATPTPNPCGSVSDDTVEPSEMIAYFNPPTYSLLGCYELIQPISVPLPELSWSPFGLPAEISISGWTVCIQLLTFAAVFAGLDWALIAGGFVTLFAIAGIYNVIKSQT